MSEQRQEIISVSQVADGNPSTVMSLANQLRQQGGNPIETYLVASSLPVNLFHRAMTADPEDAKRYTETSEEKRVNVLSRAYAKICFADFAGRILCNDDFDRDYPSRWNIVQEHQLLGARPKTLNRLGIDTVRLVVPDVFPKESAELAVEEMAGASISVWNTQAYDYLRERNFKVELHRPYLLDGFRPNTDTFCNEGLGVVVKSSGNGMPKKWQHELQQSLGLVGQEWALHTPQGRIAHDLSTAQNLSKRSRIESFYNDVGGRTRLLIGYPSELVGLVCELRERGVPTWMITLPPRGAHERRNLRFAIDNNIVLGELGTEDYYLPPTFTDLRRITSNTLKYELDTLPEATWQSGIVGTKSFWS